MSIVEFPELKALLVRDGRLMALDVGSKTIGIATSDALRMLATPLTTLKRGKLAVDLAALGELTAKHQIKALAVGLPLNMDGTEQPLTARARKFANRIHGRFGVTVTLHDERLSTVEARSGLFEQGGYRALNKGKVDSASAVIILESYFEQGY